MSDPTSGGNSAPGAPAPSNPASEQPRDERGRFTAKDYRYTRDDGVPEWAVGRTAAEVATIGDQFYRSSLAAPQQQRAAPTAPTPQYAAPSAPQVPSADEWATDPGAASQRFASYLQQQQAPQFEQLQQQLGMQARDNAAMRFATEFKRWGPDIDAKLRQYLPSPAQWTPQAIEAVVGVVRGEHADELANELAEKRVQELIKQGGTALGRSDGAAVAGASASGSRVVDFNSNELPPERRQLLQMSGATPQALDELLRKFYPGLPLDKARERWFEAAKKGDVLAEYHVKKEVNASGVDQRRTGVTING